MFDSFIKLLFIVLLSSLKALINAGGPSARSVTPLDLLFSSSPAPSPFSPSAPAFSPATASATSSSLTSLDPGVTVMAPSFEVPVFQSDSIPDENWDAPSRAKGDGHSAYTPGFVPVVSHDHYEHDDLRPQFPDFHWPPLTEVTYHDRGLQGRPDFGRLLNAATDVFDYAPKIGTEVQGIRLSQLTDAQKDDLARLVAVRGVVFFRQQDDFTIERQRQLGQYFGTLHKHATTAVPRRPGLEDVHVVFADGNSKDQRALFTPTFLWHSDVRNRSMELRFRLGY